MKRYARLAMALATTTLLTGSVFAQESNDSKDKESDKKNKLNQYDELIIRKKSDKDEKVTIEIKNGEVTVNGKPLSDYDNDNLSIRNSRSGRVIITSPFRDGRGGGNSFEYFNGDRKAAGTRAFLGVTTEEAPGGARITNVSKGSAAEKAGLKAKDIIRKIDDEKVQDENDVSRIIRAHKPEDKVKLTILRDEKEQTITATLGQTKDVAQSYNFNYDAPNDLLKEFKLDELDFGQGFNPPRAFGFTGPNGRPKIGIKAQDTEGGVGVKVLDVQEGSAAEKAGIKEDDIITEFNGKKVNSADELSREVADAKDKPKSSVKLLRNGKTVNLDILTPKKLKTANL